MKKQTFFFSSAILIFSAAITKLIGALFRIPLANLLGGTGMGYFSGAYGIFMTIYALSVTGLPTAVAKLTAENSALGRFENMRKIKSVSLEFFSITGMIFTAVLVVSATPFCLATSDAATIPSVLMIAPSIFFCCITSVYRGYYEGLRNMFPTAVSQIIEGLFKLAAGLAFCVYVLKNPDKFEAVQKFFGGCDISAVAAAAAVLGITISSAAGTVFLIIRDKLFGDGFSEADFTDRHADNGYTIIMQLMKTALPVAIGALVTNLTSLIDIATINKALEGAITENPLYFSDIANGTPLDKLPNFLFGSYTGLAVTVFNLIPSFTNMFGKGILPSVSEAYAANDNRSVRLNTEKAILSTAIIAVPSGLGIFALSENILRFLFPSKELETVLSSSALSVLGIAVIFLCISSTAFSVLQALGKPYLPVKIMAAGVAVKLIGNLFLTAVPELNIAGAALSTLLCYIVICAPSLYYMIKLTGIGIRSTFTALGKLLLCSGLCAATAHICENVLSNAVNPVVSLFISIFFGVIIYIFSGFVLGIFTKSSLKLLIS